MTRTQPDAVDVLAGVARATYCRHWLPDKGRQCGVPGTIVVWGKYADPEEFGPKCDQHWPSWFDGSRSDQYAVVDLRPLRRVLEPEEPRPPQVGDLWSGDRILVMVPAPEVGKWVAVDTNGYGLLARPGDTYNDIRTPDGGPTGPFPPLPKEGDR